MVVYGRRVAIELKRSGGKPKRVWVKRSLLEFAKELFPQSDIRCVHPKLISKLCDGEEHQGIAMEVELKLHNFLSVISKADEKSIFIFLDGVQDVGNIGNIIRTSEFFGCTAVLLSKEDTPDITPAVVKASAGAIFHIPISKEKRKKILESLKRVGKIYAFDVNGSTDLFDPNFRFELPITLCFGSEQKGVSEETLRYTDKVVRIPGVGKVGSINVSSSVAAAVAILRKEEIKQIKQK